MHLTELGDRIILRRDGPPRSRPRAPKVEDVKRLLDEHRFDQKGMAARRLVQQARAMLEEHLREAWACGAVVVCGESAIKTRCGCRHCEAWAPIAEIELPPEEPRPKARTADGQMRVTTARIPAEEYYRRT